MPNVPKRPKSDTSRLEGKAYLTYDEVSEYLGIRRSSLYNILTELDVKTHKFKLDKKRYVSIEDARRVKQMREQPWLAGTDETEEESAHSGSNQPNAA